jgi:hypothetical protein
MTRQRFILLLVAALLALAAAFTVSIRRYAPHETPGLALLPGLGDLDAVSTVTVRKGGTTPSLTLHKVGPQWSVAERADYPADVPKLRTLLVALRDARIIEEKTSDPARFAEIGVDDPGHAGAVGAEITVVTGGTKTAVIVGKSVGEGNFVRRQGENRSFAVQPSITVETEPRFWIDARLLDVPAALIQGIDYKPAAGPAFALHRLNPADGSYSLEGVPPGRKARDAHALAPSSSLLSGLTAEDVAASGSVEFTAPSQVTVTLTDGNVLTLSGVAVADKHWIEVKSSKDSGLTAKTQGRLFEIAGYRYDEIFRPLEQLLEPLPQKTAPLPKAGSKPAPAGGPAAKSRSSAAAPLPPMGSSPTATP